MYEQRERTVNKNRFSAITFMFVNNMCMRQSLKRARRAGFELINHALRAIKPQSDN